MKSFIPSPPMGVALLALVVALGGAGVAATGGNFILGNDNTASTRSALRMSGNVATLLVSNTSASETATALRLSTPADRPPMVVDSSVKVANLNAALLDGLSYHAFQRAGIEGWHYINNVGEPPFENGWWIFEPNQINYAFPSFRKDRNGIVSLRGIIKGGAIGQNFFRLPAAYCPRTIKIFAALSSNSLARITIYPRPVPCPVFANFGSNAWVSLDGISFPFWGSDG